MARGWDDVRDSRAGENETGAPSHLEGTRPANERCRLNRKQLVLAYREKCGAHLLEASVPYARHTPPSAEEFVVAARAHRVVRTAQWSINARAVEEVGGAIRTRTTLAHVIAHAYQKICNGRTKRGVGLSCLQESFSLSARAAGEKHGRRRRLTIVRLVLTSRLYRN